MNAEKTTLIIGRNPVLEALKSGHEIDRLLVARDTEGSIIKIIGAARDRRIPIHYTDKAGIDRICGGRAHQGVVAYISPYGYCELEDIVARAEQRNEDLFVILLDGIEDPHNLGAIIRSANAAGAHGVIIPKRRAVGLTDTVVKASAGAVEYTPIARVSNIAQTVEKLKSMGVWTFAADMGGESCFRTDMKGRIALVIGGEGDGVSRLVAETCDFRVSIPIAGEITSLNASNAAAVLLYEIYRQRRL